MAYGLSNGHVTDDVTWPQRCCEAVRSAILATAWLLVTSTPTGSSASPLSALSLKTDNFKFWWVSRWNITDIYLRRKQTKLHVGVRYCFSYSYSFSYRWREFGATFVERSRRPSVGTRCRRAARRYRARSAIIVPSEIFSPASGGRQKPTMTSTDSRIHGTITFIT